ncbi:putative amidoligase [Pyronema domesticum]|nr:putative amidoligase [Pyronema domesticum]
MASATFGIELECISASKLQTNPARDIVRSWHKHRITKAKYRCIFSRSDDDDNELSPLNPTPNSSQSSSTNSDSSSQSKKSEKSEKSEPELIQSRSEHYNKWSIKFERSIPYEIEDIENLLKVENLIYADDEKPHERAMKTMDGKYWVNHHPVELVSRILHFKKQPKETKWDTEIKEVVGAFKDESDGKVRSMVNKRCGFHVHLGPPEGDKERSFEDLQKLASVFVLLEDLLDEMHPVHRRHGNPDIKSLSERYKTEDPENWQENAWDAIWSSSRRSDLIIAVNSIESDGGRFECRRWKVGLETNLNTTEVRVFEGTLDTEVIVGWVKFLEEFVRKTTIMVELSESVM